MMGNSADPRGSGHGIHFDLSAMLRSSADPKRPDITN